MTTLSEAARDLASAVESKMSAVGRTLRDLRDQVGATDAPEVETKADREHHQAFHDWLKNPTIGLKRLREAERELKIDTATLGTSLLGGAALPKALQVQIDAFARTVNPWLDPAICGSQTVGSSDFHAIVGLSDATSSRAAESGSRSQTSTPNFRDRAPAWGEYYAYAQAYKFAVDDIPQLENMLVTEIGSQIATGLANDIIAGSGSSGQVRGIVTQAPVTTIDAASPVRNANAIQYVPTLSIASPVTSPTIQDVENLLSTFAEKFLMDDSFAIMMRPSTFRSIMRFSDSKEAPYMMPRRPTLFGYPVRFTSAVAAVAPNAFPIIAGAWRRAYILVDRGNMEIVNDVVTQPGLHKWHVARRFGGTVLVNDSVKCIKCATS
jgi:HK97 family phage major capsid protein